MNKNNSDEILKKVIYDLDTPELDETEEKELIDDNTYFDKIDKLYSKINSKKPISKEEKLSESFDEAARRVELDSQAIDTFCNVIEEDTHLKKTYAKVLIFMLAMELLVINGIFIFIGIGWLNYTEVVLNIFIGATLLEILGLVTIIVNYLFKDNITKALNNILVNNKSNK